MGRLFGTDGIRGIANRDLSIRRAEEVGMALAEVIRGEHPEKRPTVVIGRDTRLSGEMLQAALAGGLIVGALAQRTRLCMVGGIRDVMLFRDWFPPRRWPT